MNTLFFCGKVISSRWHEGDKAKVLTLVLGSSRRLPNGKAFVDYLHVKVWGDQGAMLKEVYTVGQTLVVSGRPEAAAYQRDDKTVAAQQVVHADRIELVDGTPLADSNKK